MKNGRDVTFSAATADFRILIVDDEKVLCSFLEEALIDKYKVATCYTAQAAIDLIGSQTFDVVVSDLRLPDLSGIDVLRFAKEKDEFVEVIMITGYASLDSAARAINLGASSYLIKPLALDELTQQIGRAVASRSFHLKSLHLIQQSQAMPPEVKNHLYDVTTLYHFSRKLMISLDLNDVFQVILQDTNERMDAVACAVAINFMEFGDIFMMPRCGALDQSEARTFLTERWDACFDFLDKKAFTKGETPLTLLEGKKGAVSHPGDVQITRIPMIVKGKNVGVLVIFTSAPLELSESESQFLQVYASLVSSIVDHAYSDFRDQLMAKTDSLTGIANHRLFTESLEREISRADRRKASFTLLMIDIDDFKKVNDTYGHPVGDKVIKDLTQRVGHVIRRGDLLARYGGEEFALILPDTDAGGTHTLAERIRRTIADTPMPLIDGEVPYTVSLGIAAYDGQNPKSKDDLVAQADRALYDSKKRGKNCVSTA